MNVYVVISNGEVNGSVEGVFTDYEDAKKCFAEIKANWLDWATGCEFEDDDTEEDYYCITNFDEDEFLEVSITECEVK